MVWAVSFLATFPVISLRDQSVKIADNFPKKKKVACRFRPTLSNLQWAATVRVADDVVGLNH